MKFETDDKSARIMDKMLVRSIRDPDIVRRFNSGANAQTCRMATDIGHS